MSRVPTWTKGGSYSTIWKPTPDDVVEVWEKNTATFDLMASWCILIPSRDLRVTGKSDTVAKAKIDAAHFYRVLKEASKTT